MPQKRINKEVSGYQSASMMNVYDVKLKTVKPPDG